MPITKIRLTMLCLSGWVTLLKGMGSSKVVVGSD